MRLGIPGSIAMVLPDHVSCLGKNAWVETMKVTAFAAGSIAFAMLHMVQHFMQP